MTKEITIPKDLVKAVDIVRKLQKWIDGTENMCERPTATLTWADCHLSISIGDVPVWYDDIEWEDEITFEGCIRTYRRHIEELMLAFPEFQKGKS